VTAGPRVTFLQSTLPHAEMSEMAANQQSTINIQHSLLFNQQSPMELINLQQSPCRQRIKIIEAQYLLNVLKHFQKTNAKSTINISTRSHHKSAHRLYSFSSTLFKS